MTIAEFIHFLALSDIQLKLHNDTLSCIAPKGALTKDLTEQIKQQKPAIIAFLKEALTFDDSHTKPIPIISRGSNIPLSINQQSMWFVDQLIPNQLGYNLPCLYQLSGKLDLAALNKSFTEIIRRHEILRTTFITKNLKPVQIISAPWEVKLIPYDVSNKQELAEEAFRPYLSAKAKTPFDLTKGPLVTIDLVKVSEEVHLFQWMTHHLVWDGWSFDILINELSLLYTAFTHDKPSPLAENSIQYADYAAWQKGWLLKTDESIHLNYWKQNLSKSFQPLYLPTDRPRPKIRSYNAGRIKLDLPLENVEKLKFIGSQNDATLFMVLLAGFTALLHRYSGQTDITIGSPMWGRVRPETENLIGFFTNTVVLRIDISDKPSFSNLILRVKHTCLDAASHQAMPFEHVVEKLPEISKQPLFQTLFTFQDARTRPTEMNNISIRQLPEQQTGVTSFDVSLWFKESKVDFIGRLDYNTDIFDAETMAKFIRHLRSLFEKAANNPSTPLDELEIFEKGDEPQSPQNYKTPSGLTEENTQTIKQAFFAFAPINGVAITCITLITGEQRILAYYTLKTNHEATISEIRKHLKENLPASLVPRHFMEVDEIPLTSTNQADFGKLPLPPDLPITHKEVFLPPQTSGQKYLATLWGELLGKETIGLHDNFFEIGGYSLLSMILIDRIAREKSLQINPRVLLLNNLKQIAQEYFSGV